MNNETPESRAELNESEAFHAICDELRIGSQVRQQHIVMENIRNLIRRTRCLDAIEIEFFTSEKRDEEDEPYDHCELNWGANPAEYVEQFRAALAARSLPAVAGDQAIRDALLLCIAALERTHHATEEARVNAANAARSALALLPTQSAQKVKPE
jgi:acid stress-induced BolA-like protein IbaG/YrbA